MRGLIKILNFQKNNLDNFLKQLKEIKLVIMDFDGVLTDSGIYISNDGNNLRRFDVKDGLGIKLLQINSITTAIVSGSNSEVINQRGDALGIKIIKKSVTNKFEEVKNIQKETNLKPKQTLFLGDDINDLSVIPLVQLFIVPCNAHKACKSKASLIGKCNGGNGFIREVTDQILIAKGIDPFSTFYGHNDMEMQKI